jgi:hypothetical protein
MLSKRPSARAAVKAGEAAREAGCLYGEHGDGAPSLWRSLAFTLGREKGCADAAALLEKLQIE